MKNRVIFITLSIIVISTSLIVILRKNNLSKISDFTKTTVPILVIEDNNDFAEANNEETTRTTNTDSNYIKTNSIKTSKVTTSSFYDTTTKYSTARTKNTYKKTTKKYTEEDIITYAEGTYKDVKNSKTLKESVKEKVITLIDFIFYDKTINGVSFKSLSSSAKVKVIYYTLKVDNFIESKFPEYKKILNNKVSNLKQKLIAKYMDLSYSICIRNEDACNETKANFAELKRDVKITWDLVSGCVKYGASKASVSIKNWYEVFSGKV